MTSLTKRENLRFCVGIDQKLLGKGVVVPLRMNFHSVPHLLIVAPSGSGKTYLLTYILGQIAKKDVQLILADFKGIDFICMDGCENYYRHNTVAEALALVFEELQKRMHNPRQDYKPIFFCIDEWSGFLGACSKKEQELYKQRLSSILMLGRGIGVFVILALQRADSTYITGRDNIGNCIGLGRLSRESVLMIFPDDREQIEPKGQGKGYLRIDGKPLKELAVPRLRDRDRTLKEIQKALDA